MSNSEKIEAFKTAIQSACQEILNEVDQSELKDVLSAIGAGSNVVVEACQDEVEKRYRVVRDEIDALEARVKELSTEKGLTTYAEWREDGELQTLQKMVGSLEDTIYGMAGPTGYEFGELLLCRSRSGNFSWRRKDDWDSSSDYC